MTLRPVTRAGLALSAAAVIAAFAACQSSPRLATTSGGAR